MPNAHLYFQERVLGLHYFGPNAGEVMQGYGIAFKLGATKQHFSQLIGIHPTSAEVVMFALVDVDLICLLSAIYDSVHHQGVGRGCQRHRLLRLSPAASCTSIHITSYFTFISRLLAETGRAKYVSVDSFENWRVPL